MEDYGASAGMGVGMIIFYLAVAVFMLVCVWKVFVKAGKPGWAAIVPFYNLYVEFEIAWGKGILFLLLLIPIVDVVVGIICMYKLCKAFGKGVGFFVLMLLLPIIAWPILAFGSDQYIGPQ